MNDASVPVGTTFGEQLVLKAFFLHSREPVDRTTSAVLATIEAQTSLTCQVVQQLTAFSLNFIFLQSGIH